MYITIANQEMTSALYS